MALNALLLRRSPFSCTLFNRFKVTSSAEWYRRQTKDPYVWRAKVEHYRCRSAFKLLEINERYRFLKAGMSVLDCGAAPGSWTEVLVKLVNASNANPTLPAGRVFAADKAWMAPVAGATVLDNFDILDADSVNRLSREIGLRSLDAIVCDAAPNATGSASVDHERIVQLCQCCLEMTPRFFRPSSGVYLCKLWQGARETEFAEQMKKYFYVFRVVKPKASRKESAEIYFMGERFKGECD